MNKVGLGAMQTQLEMFPEGTTVGRKFDSGKLDYTLIPWDGLEEVVKVLEFGAKKYDRDNWRYVENAETRYTAAAFRHLIAYNKGEQTDSETGLSHLAHAGCCLLFLLALESRNGSNT
jgi:hypothetical protein